MLNANTCTAKDLTDGVAIQLDWTAMTSSLLAGFGIGVALAGAPGPVQAVIVAESARDTRRGLAAVAGASLSFGTLLVALALGLSAVAVSGPLLRLLQVAGGAFLLWLALDGLRSAGPVNDGSEPRGRSVPPPVRGSLAVLLNPGAWLFLGAVASPLIGASAQAGGTPAAVATALALMAGAACGDAVLALVAGFGLRRAGRGVGAFVQRALAVVLAALGAWLIVMGVLQW